MPDYKIVVLGTGGVGKSCLTIRYIQDVFIDTYDPTIEDSYRHQVEISDRSVVLEILDTAGTQQFHSMRDMYMKSGEGFLIVYSIVDKTTFVEAEELYGDLLRVRDQDAASIPLLLVGNKCDLADQRKVSFQEGQQKAAKWHAQFYETSAKTDTNISEVFIALTKIILKMGGNEKKKNTKKSKCLIL
jgi:small GTP-binding protein